MQHQEAKKMSKILKLFINENIKIKKKKTTNKILK